jgi:cytochrome c2
MGSLLRGLATASLSMLLLVASPAVAEDDGPLVAQARRLFEECRCCGCHAIGGTGAKTAPDLSNVGHRYALACLTY